MSETKPPLRVALLALPEAAPAALYGLQEVLGAAGRTWETLTGEPESARRLLDPVIVSRDGQVFASPLGPEIAVQASLAELDGCELVVVSDLVLGPADDPRGRWRDEAAWLRARREAGATICSICTGSVFLAEAGLLEGAEATSHWAVAPLFRRHYPQARLRQERILCAADAEQRIVTSGGASAWSDLALHLIARHCGETEARRMAKAFLIGDRSEGQLPFAALSRPMGHADELIRQVQCWIAECYAEPNPVSRMARHSGLADRTFARRFRAATGLSPVDYVQELRIEEAKQLLEATAEPTDAVGAAVGYEDPAFFRRLFKRRTGVTPARYRQRMQRYRAVGLA